MLNEQRVRIRALNDQLRQEGRTGGRLLITRGVLALGDGAVAEALEALARFDDSAPAMTPTKSMTLARSTSGASSSSGRSTTTTRAFGAALRIPLIPSVA